MPYNRKAIRQIKEVYSPVRKKISSRLNDFKQLWEKGTEENIFSELVFCLLTPQSKAKTCWESVGDINRGRHLYKAGVKALSARLCNVRFRNNKARYIIEARKKFSRGSRINMRPLIDRFCDVQDLREWLVRNVKGIGYKEASHFIRNIGKGQNVAILDRHVLKNLKIAGVIKGIPRSISRKTYFDIENRMKAFAKRIKIPLSHLDLALWYKETGDVFK